MNVGMPAVGMGGRREKYEQKDTAGGFGRRANDPTGLVYLSQQEKIPYKRQPKCFLSGFICCSDSFMWHQ
jgi:hypothetical protein